MDEKKTKIPGRGLLLTSSIIMLILALPMAWWTFRMAYSVSPYDAPGDGLATLGCVVGAAAYIWSAVPAICALVFSKKTERYRACRILGWLTAALTLFCAVTQRTVFLFTVLPLAVITALYLLAAYAPKRTEKKEQGQ